jgi:hypothetical protein
LAALSLTPRSAEVGDDVRKAVCRSDGPQRLGGLHAGRADGGEQPGDGDGRAPTQAGGGTTVAQLLRWA